MLVAYGAPWPAGSAALDNVRSLGFDGSAVYLTNSSGVLDDAAVKYDTGGRYVTLIPESGTLVLLGLAGLIAVRRR